MGKETGRTNAKKGKLIGSLLWALGSSGPAVAYLLTAQLTYAMTESFGISALSAGMVFLVSRIFDGFTDIIAGTIIDRTRSKLGKGRVWDLCAIPAWIFTILSFSVPIGWSEIGKIVFIFLMYNMYASVFNTLIGCADTIRLKNTFDEDARIHAVAVNGILGTMISAVSSIALPILIGIFGNQPHGWTIISTIYAVPCCILTLLRFFFLPEIRSVEEKTDKEERIGFVASIKAVITNKYVVIVFLVAFLRALVVTATGSAGTYYFTYVYGDVSAAAIPGMISMFVFLGAALLPKLVEKLGNAKTIIYSLILTSAALLLRYLMPTNLTWYTICSAVSGLASLPVSYLGPMMLIDAMDYNRWKKGSTPEGVFSAARSIADKIGLGLGSAATGIILQLGVLPEGGYSASSISFLNNGFPAVCWVIVVVILLFYDLDKKMPRIKKELAEKEA